MTKENDTHGNTKEFNWDVFDALLQFKVSKKFCAEYMSVSEDLIERRLREVKDMTFTQYHQLKMQKTGMKLQQKILEKALDGNMTALIFALKNMAGWSDKVEQTVKELPEITLAYKRKGN